MVRANFTVTSTMLRLLKLLKRRLLAVLCALVVVALVANQLWGTTQDFTRDISRRKFYSLSVLVCADISIYFRRHNDVTSLEM